jgi:hypothetical protein
VQSHLHSPYEVIRSVSPVTIEVRLLSVMISRASYPMDTGASFTEGKAAGT